MKIRVNGSDQQIALSQISVLDLLKENQVAAPEMVSVQLNQEFVNKDQFGSVLVKDGDELDFLYFMGGGTGLRG
jgi:sulfur carrier protein